MANNENTIKIAENKNEEKAREFANYFAGETDYKESAAYSSAIAMAEWKDEQTKQFVIEFSRWLNERGFFRDDLQCDLEHQARTFLEKKGFDNAYE